MVLNWMPQRTKPWYPVGPEDLPSGTSCHHTMRRGALLLGDPHQDGGAPRKGDDDS